MKVILLEKVRNLGSIGNEVNVKSGYARNYLLPQKKAMSATKENIANIAAQRAELEKREAELLAKAKERAATLEKLALINIQAKVSEDGKLFGSINIREIVEALKNAGIEVSRHEVSMPQGAIRKIGEYDIDIQLHTDVTETIKVKIVAEA